MTNTVTGAVTITPHKPKGKGEGNADAAASSASQTDPAPAEPSPPEEPARLLEMLQTRRFDFDKQPPPPLAVFSLGGKTICTPGNITNIQAGIKAGKTAVVTAMLASAIKGFREGGDLLGFASENPQCRALIHFDTEQSRYDADMVIRRAINRAGLGKEPPPWLMSYSIADMDPDDRRDALSLIMKEARDKFGGVHSVLIDGVGDLLLSLNEEESAFDLVGELHSLAITYDCPIVTVLHENPGSETGKTRGHLGSQLQRKAETNLRLAKDNGGITTVWTDGSRHCHIPKDHGTCFRWDEHAGMHVSCGTAAECKVDAKRAKMREAADRVLRNEPDGLGYKDLIDAIMDVCELKDRAADTRRNEWLEAGVIRKDSSGIYHLA